MINFLAPDWVRNVTYTSVSDLEVNLNWLYTCESNDKIDKFIIKVNGTSIVGDNEDVLILKESKILEYKTNYTINITNLSYAFIYFVDICPENYEEECNNVTFNTPEGRKSIYNCNSYCYSVFCTSLLFSIVFLLHKIIIPQNYNLQDIIFSTSRAHKFNIHKNHSKRIFGTMETTCNFKRIFT